jgi:hypothetical protein
VLVSAVIVHLLKCATMVSYPPPFRTGALLWRVADFAPGGRAAPLPALGRGEIGAAGDEERSHFVKGKNYAKVC